ncbi:Crp/Fnr family transcriptional regulator [Verticiella sediminum]|uniref:Crp/Fnr family transcriptional regulator n=1 Tax=Verticiella sediminum TaxID=1247510 RepID=A0A556B1X5_9BURK|nr:Crp/Fnr family transcriptional regulator [Verticiella sediminum]TSH99160.1 Crp/Fnr family transcriptional regulator [Verticiella sediminum]
MLTIAPSMAAGGHDSIASGLFLSENASLVGCPSTLLDMLTPQEQAQVRMRGRTRLIEAGDDVFVQGDRHDGIYLIERGQVRVFYTAPSGRQITLAYWNAGNFVGGPQVFGNSVHSWSGVATMDTTVLMLPGLALRALVTDIPALAVGIIEGLAFKGECYSALAQMLGTRSVAERLIHLLVRLSEIYGVAEDASIRIAADFNHADLANVVGATRQWVTAMLSRLQDQGVVRMHKGQVVIVDRRKLLALERSSR